MRPYPRERLLAASVVTKTTAPATAATTAILMIGLKPLSIRMCDVRMDRQRTRWVKGSNKEIRNDGPMAASRDDTDPPQEIIKRISRVNQAPGNLGLAGSSQARILLAGPD
jgi:hypothetical protein